MDIPVNWQDVQLWVSMVTVILLLTSELIVPLLGEKNVYIDKRRLRLASIFSAVIFILIFAFTVYADVFLT